jgi:hypothetical protein
VEALVRCSAGESAVRAIVVVVLPFLKLVVEEPDIVGDLVLEESVELFGVDAVRSLYFAVEPGRLRSDLDVSDALIQHVPGELDP